MYFQLSGSSTTETGIRLIPHTVGASIGSLGTGLIMKKTGTYKLLLMISMTLFVAGEGFVATVNLDTTIWPPILYLFVLGIGFGGTLTTTLLAIIAAVDHEHQAVITSALYAFRSTGSTLGITICSAVYQNILRTELLAKFGDEPGAREEIQRIRDSFEELDHLPSGWRAGVLVSFMDALRGVFLTGLGMAILAFISAAFVREHVLHTTLERR
jgi:MFS family permease